jgi:peptide/nickel transport system permease protein
LSVGGPQDIAAQEEVTGALETGTIGLPTEVAARSPWQLFWRRFKKDKVAVASGLVVVMLIMVAIFAPLIVNLVGAPGPNVQQFNTLNEFGLPTGPSAQHLMGVDQVGRDVFSRIIYGSRVSLQVAILATFISVTLGTALGLIAGFNRGWIDSLLARAMDIMLAFPFLLLALGIGAACSLGNGCIGGLITPGLPVVISILALGGLPYAARIVRGQVLSLREKEFVEASRSLGASTWRIMFREVLPNLVAPIIVYCTLIIPTNILAEAALSFLGIGVQPPEASWGSMISDASQIYQNAWWFMLFPGIALIITVLSFNLLGDGLQDALNPKGDRS